MSLLLDPTASFVALDFETATPKKESACEIGLVFVDAASRKLRRFTSRIKPPARDFHPACQRVHGIRWSDVADKPTFAELWPEIKRFLEGARFLVAHNAAFDAKVIAACCEYYNIAPPHLPFECSLKLAKELWPNSGVKLNECASRIGFALKHHAAASDAEACARLIIWARDQRAEKPVVDTTPNRNELIARREFFGVDLDAQGNPLRSPLVVVELLGNPKPAVEPPVPWEHEKEWVKREMAYLGHNENDDPTARWAAGTRKKQDEPRLPNVVLEEIASWDPPPRAHDIPAERNASAAANSRGANTQQKALW